MEHERSLTPPIPPYPIAKLRSPYPYQQLQTQQAATTPSPDPCACVKGAALRSACRRSISGGVIMQQIEKAAARDDLAGQLREHATLIAREVMRVLESEASEIAAV
jgi:hypothetical protein